MAQKSKLGSAARPPVAGLMLVAMVMLSLLGRCLAWHIDAEGSKTALESEAAKRLGRLLAEHKPPGFVERPQDSSSPYCMLCQGIAGLLGPLLEANFTDDKIILPIAIKVCELLPLPCETKSACETLCQDVVPEFTREIIVIALESNLRPAEICGVLTICPMPPPPGPPIPPGEHVPVPSNLSDTTGQRQWPSWSQTSGMGTFVQLSDIHLDSKYLVGALTDCPLPLCCRAETGMGTNANNSAGEWGDYHCDPPLYTVENLFQFIAALDPAPDFILYTGDDPAHDIWEQSREDNLASITTISNLFLKYFPDTPVFSSIGNHESFPVNMYEGHPYDSWLYDPISQLWAPYLPENAIPTLQYGGYYAAHAFPGLVVVSLNTNFYSSDDFWLYVNNTDFSGQLAWLSNVLAQTRERGEKAIIIGHAPTNSWTDAFGWGFNALLTDYSDVVVGGFYGHHHISAELVHFNNASLGPGQTPKPISVAYIVGSVTPYTQLNPGFRVYHYDRSSLAPNAPLPYLVQDFDQYWFNLEKDNEKNRTPKWEVKYTANDFFGLPDQSPDSWAQFGLNVATNLTLYQNYVKAYYRGVPQDADSNFEMSCEILSATGSIYKECESGDRKSVV